MPPVLMILLSFCGLSLYVLRIRLLVAPMMDAASEADRAPSTAVSFNSTHVWEERAWPAAAWAG